MNDRIPGSATLDHPFPASWTPGTCLLRPITSWAEMHEESQAMGVEFEEFWYDHVQSGVACFFRWLGSPRATVLVIRDAERITHVECRKAGDVLLSERETAPILSSLNREAIRWLPSIQRLDH